MLIYLYTLPSYTPLHPSTIYIYVYIHAYIYICTDYRTGVLTCLSTTYSGEAVPGGRGQGGADKVVAARGLELISDTSDGVKRRVEMYVLLKSLSNRITLH